jgi:electron transfer flavoprotein beta subunit
MLVRERRACPVKVLVCIKQVPDSFDTLEIRGQTGWFTYMPLTVFRMNRFDEFALEEALQMRERVPGTTVHALSVGPQRVGATVRRALEMGADHGIHILARADEYVSPSTVAHSIAAYARPRGYDLIITGVMAEDDMACLTGQLAAAILDLPCATSVIHAEIHPESQEVRVDSEIEGGSRASFMLSLPAVLTIQSGINTPRYPSLSNVLRARSQQQEIIAFGDLEIPPPQDICSGIRSPDMASLGLFIGGTPREKARRILEILREKTILP